MKWVVRTLLIGIVLFIGVAVFQGTRPKNNQPNLTVPQSSVQRPVTSSSSYVGTWKAETGNITVTLVMNNNGTGLIAGMGQNHPFTWKIKGDHADILDTKTHEKAVARPSDDFSSLTVGAPGDSAIYVRQH